MNPDIAEIPGMCSGGERTPSLDCFLSRQEVLQDVKALRLPAPVPWGTA